MNTTALYNELLSLNKGGQYVSFEHAKVLKSNKDNKNHTAVIKTAYKNVYVGGDYQKKVLGRLKQAGLPQDYELSKTWGEHANQVLVEWNGKQYMQAYMVKNTIKECLGYEIDGKPATLQEIEKIVRPSELTPKSSNCQKQQIAGLDEDEQIVTKKFSLENILSIRINGKLF